MTSLAVRQTKQDNLFFKMTYFVVFLVKKYIQSTPVAPFLTKFEYPTVSLSHPTLFTVSTIATLGRVN